MTGMPTGTPPGTPPAPVLSRYRRIISYAVQIVIIGFFAWFIVQNKDTLAALRNVSWQQILWIALLEIISFVIGSAINYSMIRKFDTQVSFLDCLLLQYVNNLLNKILPTIGGGAAFRAIYLKKKYKFPYTYFASTIAGLYVISFFTTSLIGLLCSALIYAQYQTFNLPIFISFLGILLVTLFIIVFSPTVPKSERRVLKVLRSVIEGWNTLKKDPKLVIIYTVLTIALLIIATLQIQISYQALGVQADLVAMVFLSTLGIILAFLNFTPDGIGVKEGIYYLSKNLVRIEAGVLILGSLLLRGISILTTFIIGGASYWLLMRELHRIDQEPLAARNDL